MLDLSTATSPEAGEAIARGTVAVLAVGALEQHGAHLPLSTDTVMAGGVARKIAEAVDGLLLPPIAYGEAWSCEGFPGTLSLSADTIRAIVRDLGRGLTRAGVKALVVVNGHFGNQAPITAAIEDLRAEGALPVLALDYPGLEEIAAAVCTSEPAAPTFYHADEFETSLMLALEPQTVRMDRAAAEYPVFPENFGAEPVMLHTFCKSGVFGDPTVATAEKGERMLALVVEECLRVVRPFLAAAR